MESASQMTGGMCVLRKFRAEIDFCAAALTIEPEHRQLVCAGVHVRLNREVPAATNARNIDVIPTRCTQRRKISLRGKLGGKPPRRHQLNSNQRSDQRPRHALAPCGLEGYLAELLQQADRPNKVNVVRASGLGRRPGKLGTGFRFNCRPRFRPEWIKKYRWAPERCCRIPVLQSSTFGHRWPGRRTEPSGHGRHR